MNGDRDVDIRRIFTKFLISISWATRNILRLRYFTISRNLPREYVQEKFLEMILPIGLKTFKAIQLNGHYVAKILRDD
jgi:hypothetical protein